jgi:CRP-like cAMP-binding protein
MHCQIFQQGDILMRKGDEGDRMYISFQGSMGVYLNDDFE